MRLYQKIKMIKKEVLDPKRINLTKKYWKKIECVKLFMDKEDFLTL